MGAQVDKGPTNVSKVQEHLLEHAEDTGAQEEVGVNRQPRAVKYLISSNAAMAQNLFNHQVQGFLYQGDCRTLLASLPPLSVQLIITSPPYNIGKEYEAQQKTLEEYLCLQEEVITECVRVLRPSGSICWEVGNHIVGNGEILPLDITLHSIFAKHRLKLRNRIVWHFEHGLHAQNRLSGRYEVLMWYTKSDDYTFNLDPVRVPQKYPGKRHFKGPHVGELSGNPIGKNPSDVWIFPNVKSNHVEKTEHPCQFPIELVDRMLLATTNPDDVVLDPFAGTSTSLVAALLRERLACGAEIMPAYVEISRRRIEQTVEGTVPFRATGTPIYTPSNDKIAQLPTEFAAVRRQARDK